ncbi:MAG: hypothetical protein P8Y94_16290, partial [Acidobacteriota bacterium]
MNLGYPFSFGEGHLEGIGKSFAGGFVHGQAIHKNIQRQKAVQRSRRIARQRLWSRLSDGFRYESMEPLANKVINEILLLKSPLRCVPSQVERAVPKREGDVDPPVSMIAEQFGYDLIDRVLSHLPAALMAV